MSSKAQITAIINTIDTGGNNLASEVRSVFETLNNELFPEIENITTTINNLSLNLKFVKIGNVVTLSITYLNLGGTFIGNLEYELPFKYKSLNLSYHAVFVSDYRSSLELNPDITMPFLKPSWIELMGVPPGIVFRTTITYISNND
jgi:hypothetical protein